MHKMGFWKYLKINFFGQKTPKQSVFILILFLSKTAQTILINLGQ